MQTHSPLPSTTLLFPKCSNGSGPPFEIIIAKTILYFTQCLFLREFKELRPFFCPTSVGAGSALGKVAKWLSSWAQSCSSIKVKWVTLASLNPARYPISLDRVSTENVRGSYVFMITIRWNHWMVSREMAGPQSFSPNS